MKYPAAESRQRASRQDANASRGWASLGTNVLRFARAAPWPHATGAASALAGALLVQSAQGLWDRGSFWGVVVFTASLGWFGLAVLCEADALSRYREYVRLKGLFLRRGLCPRALRLVSGSRCQRDAALFAAREAGCGPEAAAFYRDMGYRWRHVLPDAILRNPLLFFNPVFLRATFFQGGHGRQEKARRASPGVRAQTYEIVWRF